MMNNNPFRNRITAKEVLKDLAPEELRKLASKDETTSDNNNPCYFTNIMSRSAKFTEIIYNEDLKGKQKETILKVQEYLNNQELIQVDRQMCITEGNTLHCRLYITRDYARIAYMWGELLFYRNSEGTPDSVVVDVPEWPERKVLIDSINGVTYLLGTDYCGEVKKAHLRMGMYLHKIKNGGIGLHAGSKEMQIKNSNGELEKVGFIFFGLSGTGKTTLTCHDHFLKGEEGVKIRQDDIVLMRKDGYCVGTENNFYIKTEGLEPKGQPVLCKAAQSSRAIFENVFVNEDNKLDFFNYARTTNGRAVVYREDMPDTDNSIDIDCANKIIFITRRSDVVPPVVKLNIEQAASFFMLGESIETSAGDPTQAGKSKRVVGTNPFIVGDEAEEGNRFYEILKSNPQIECYLMNTGKVGGEDGKKISIVDSTTIIKEIAKGEIKWKSDLFWDYLIPEDVPGFDISEFDLSNFYSNDQILKLNNVLKQERVEWIKKFENLKPEISNYLLKL